MGLFKEQLCACCGKKTNMLTRVKLRDGNYLCSDCTLQVPKYMAESLKSYDLEQFRELKKYITYSDNVLKNKFRQTDHFHNIHLDREHGLFYIDEGVLTYRLYLRIEELKSFSLEYEPETYKETTFTEKVKGDIKLSIEHESPWFRYEGVVARGIKADACLKGLLTKKVIYENPRGMDAFSDLMQSTFEKFVMTRDMSR